MAASDDEIEQLRDSVRDFLAGTLPGAAVRAAIDSGGFDRAAWCTLTQSLGLTGIGIPERFGADGYTFGEWDVVLEEFGAVLAPVLLLGTVVAAAAIRAADQGEPKQACCSRWMRRPRVAEFVRRSPLSLSHDLKSL